AEVLANMKEMSLSGWRKAVNECRLDIDYYAHRRWDTTEKLPWAVLDPGIEPDHLTLELNRALC
ncbi:hypothetical protein ACFLW5_01415, partial [Chloroflexota bacterium]